MTQEELTQYALLRNKFEEECGRVCLILVDSNARRGEHVDIRYASSFFLIGDSVEWEGIEYWSYGGMENHSGKFPAEFLTMSDEELLKIVEKENEEWKAELEKKKREKEERERAERMAEYEKLKKEFGG